jgi:hypothetical protein
MRVIQNITFVLCVLTMAAAGSAFVHSVTDTELSEMGASFATLRGPCPPD